MLHGLLNIEERVNVIPPSEIEVTEVYQLKNGDYYITLECDGKFSWNISSENYLPESANRHTSEEVSYEMNFEEGQPVKAALEEIERRVDEQIDLYSSGYTIHHAGVILDK